MSDPIDPRPPEPLHYARPRHDDTRPVFGSVLVNGIMGFVFMGASGAIAVFLVIAILRSNGGCGALLLLPVPPVATLFWGLAKSMDDERWRGMVPGMLIALGTGTLAIPAVCGAVFV